ncbi:NLI interacting factor-like phosphatase-domain-containing protein [Lipomyces chichibuensis]|uniref:NLI interacting factor-like phosphatase-domain-containing protein n=1 Tax=Lipomyces chichibuensis TaxID=1546026 RepID=UPI00334335C6
MNSIQFISSHVERVIGAAGQSQQPQEQSSGHPPSGSTTPKAAGPSLPLTALVSHDSSAEYGRASETIDVAAVAEANASSDSETQSDFEDGIGGDPLASRKSSLDDRRSSLCPSEWRNRWWWFFPISVFVQFIAYVLAILGSSPGVYDEGKRMAPGKCDPPEEHKWSSPDEDDVLVTRSRPGAGRIIEEDEEADILQRPEAVATLSELEQHSAQPYQHNSGDDAEVPPSIYQSSYSLPSTRQRTVRIRLARKSTSPSTDPSPNSSSSDENGPSSESSPSLAVQKSIKSPTSPAISSLSSRTTKYPRSVPPPRPLIPKHVAPKTLILDLDETLIHSMSKGGNMSTGHMVEVKLEKQHAILYYVHKRPYCDEFLKKVSLWYNLVIFTASVQEYADPVIDWLERDRKYFRARYYRQHCTFRNGGYVKDITVVEPDLSKVMIIDNSPISYFLHEDNAIAVEGWINDPSDLDLLHLVPFLNGMRYVTDVRTLISLRMGDNAFA